MRYESKPSIGGRRRRLGTFVLGLILSVALGSAGVTDGIVSSVHAAPTDSLPPVIASVVAVPGLDSATITWETDELADSLVQYGTSPVLLDQTVSDATLVTSHAIALAALQLDQIYYYRVVSADASANSATEPPGIDPPLEFTTTPPVCFEDITRIDFNSGTTFSSVSIVEIDDGEVVLQATEGSEFQGATLPTGWTSTPWTTGGTGTVGIGLLSVDGARVNTDVLYPTGRSLEFVATFGGAANQHAGLGDDTTTAPWAMFSTWSSTDQLYARTSGGSDWLIDPVFHGLGSLIGTPHLYRIDWTASSVEYYVDEVLVRTENIAVAGNMRPVFSDPAIDAVPLTVDWIRMTPYSATGEFYSRVFDAGQTSDWGEVNWNGDEPPGTSLTITVQAGETATPDGSWSSTIIPTPGDTSGLTGRYVQYIADLATTDPDQTPVLRDFSIECLTTPECIDPIDCDDSDPCTDDLCNVGTCENNALPDGDSDGTCDAEDGCPSDPLKIDPGSCGCGELETDGDSDGTPDCIDNCPSDPNADQANADADALGDVCDACPNDAANDVDGDTVCGDLDNCPRRGR